MVADTKQVRLLRRSWLLHALRRQPGASKIGLARALDISPTTIGSLVDDLVADQLVVASGLSPSTGGRRAERLLLNAGGPLAVGVDLGETNARLGLLDLAGNLVEVQSRAFRRRRSGEVDPATVTEGLQQLLGRRRDRPIAGIGLAVPGLVDRDAGLVRHATNLGWKDLPLAEVIAQRAGPVTIEHNTHAALLAEEWWGSAANADPAVFVTVGSGIGAAIRLNGTFLNGASGAAGELGHIPIADGGPECRCGRRGCLEALASSSAVQSRYRRLKAEHGDPRPAAGLGDVLEDALRGDSCAQLVFHDAARHLATGITTLVNLVNPSVVILGGELMDAEQLILPTVQTHVRARALPEANAAVRIVNSSLGGEAALIGAATLVFEAVFAGRWEPQPRAA